MDSSVDVKGIISSRSHKASACYAVDGALIPTFVLLLASAHPIRESRPTQRQIQRHLSSPLIDYKKSCWKNRGLRRRRQHEHSTSFWIAYSRPALRRMICLSRWESVALTAFCADITQRSLHTDRRGVEKRTLCLALRTV